MAHETSCEDVHIRSTKKIQREPALMTVTKLNRYETNKVNRELNDWEAIRQIGRGIKIRWLRDRRRYADYTDERLRESIAIRYCYEEAILNLKVRAYTVLFTFVECFKSCVTTLRPELLNCLTVHEYWHLT